MINIGYIFDMETGYLEYSKPEVSHNRAEKVVKDEKSKSEQTDYEDLRIEKGEEYVSSPAENYFRERNIESSRILGGGINGTELVKLDDGGLGVFKPGTRENGGTPEIGGGYKKERAVYLIDKFLKFDLVPNTVIRSVDGEEGSLQQYILDARMGEEFKKSELMENIKVAKQISRMMILDMLTGNADRHGGNFVLDGSDKVWAIDNGSSFWPKSGIIDYMEGVKKTTMNFEYDDETVQLLREFAANENQKGMLQGLLRELLGKREIDTFFKILEMLIENIVDGRISSDSMDSMKYELKFANEEYDSDLSDSINNPLFEGMSQDDVLTQLFSEGQEWSIIDNIKKFPSEKYGEIAEKIINNGKGLILAESLSKFEGIDSRDIARKLIDAGESRAIAYNIYEFGILDKEIAKKLLENKHGFAVEFSIERFGQLDKELAIILIDSNRAGTVALHLDCFGGLDEEVALLLFKNSYGNRVVSNLDKFVQLDHNKIANWLIDSGDIYSLLYNFKKFEGVDKDDIVQAIIKRGYASELISYLKDLGEFNDETNKLLVAAGMEWAVIVKPNVVKRLFSKIVSKLKELVVKIIK